MILLAQETTAEKATQVQNPGMVSFIYVLYGGLILYFLYRMYKTNIAKKSLEGEIYKFDKSSSKMLLVLGLFVAGFGIFNIFTGQEISGVLMIALIIVLMMETTSKNYFAQNGFIVDSKFVTWKELQKWAFDTEKGNFIVNYKKGFNEKQGFMKVKVEDIPNIDELVKKLKLKK